MPNQFKTTFVADPVSYTDMGRKAGAEIGKNFGAIAAISKAHRQEMDVNHGFSKSLAVEMPAGLDNAYRSGLQMAFDVMNDFAIQAKQNPTSENVSRHKAAVEQYNQFESRAVEKSNFNRQTLQKGLTQQIPGQDMTPDEVRAAWAEFDVPLDYSINSETGQIMLGGVPLMESDALNPEKGLFIVPTLHPSLAFQLGTFIPELMAKNLFKNNTDMYVLNDQGRTTGELNDSVIYDLVNRELSHKSGSAQNQAIAVDAYTHFTKGDEPFVTEDLSSAYEDYNSAVDLLEVEGVNVAQGALDENGQFIYDLTEIPAEGIQGTDAEGNPVMYNKATIEKWREAKKYYYEEGAKMIHDSLIINDATIAEDAPDEEIDFGATQAPALNLIEEGYEFAPAQGSMKAGLNEGRTYNVDRIILGNDGNVLSVTLTASETLMQAISALQASENPEDRALADLFSGQQSLTLTPESDDYAKVMAQIRNTDNGTNSKFSNSQFIDAATQKILMHAGGELNDVWLNRRGWGGVEESDEINQDPPPIADMTDLWLTSLALPGNEELLAEHEARVRDEGEFQGLDEGGEPVYGAPVGTDPEVVTEEVVTEEVAPEVVEEVAPEVVPEVVEEVVPEVVPEVVEEVVPEVVEEVVEEEIVPEGTNLLDEAEIVGEDEVTTPPVMENEDGYEASVERIAITESILETTGETAFEYYSEGGTVRTANRQPIVNNLGETLPENYAYLDHTKHEMTEKNKNLIKEVQKEASEDPVMFGLVSSLARIGTSYQLIWLDSEGTEVRTDYSDLRFDYPLTEDYQE